MFKDLIHKIFKKTVYTARQSGGEFLLKKTDFGLVRVDFSVVKSLAERVLKPIAGINELQVVVEKYSSANPLKVSLTLTLTEGHSAPRISEAADKAINDELRQCLGLEFYVPVDVRVERIATKALSRKRRVR